MCVCVCTCACVCVDVKAVRLAYQLITAARPDGGVGVALELHVLCAEEALQVSHEM